MLFKNNFIYEDTGISYLLHPVLFSFLHQALGHTIQNRISTQYQNNMLTIERKREGGGGGGTDTETNTENERSKKRFLFYFYLLG